MGQSLNLVNGLPFVQPKAKIGGIFCCFSFSSAYIYSTPLDELLILTEITAKQKRKNPRLLLFYSNNLKKPNTKVLSIWHSILDWIKIKGQNLTQKSSPCPFIQILYRCYPDFISMLSWIYPNFIQVKSE